MVFISVEVTNRTSGGTEIYTKTVKVLGITVYRMTAKGSAETNKPIGFSTFPDERQYVDDDD